MKRFCKLVFISAVLSFTAYPTPHTLSARVINIPDDEETIQSGIDATEDGDTVLVQPGIYVENINFEGKAITVGSLLLTTGDEAYIDSTIIDADSSGSVVRFDSEEDENSILTGFTLTGGIGSPDEEPNDDEICGGGIHCYRSSPCLTYLRIMDNRADYGGGIFIKRSSPSIYRLEVSFNSARFAGGGFQISTDSEPSISYTDIHNNEAGGYGGGIRCWYGNKIELINVTVFCNSSTIRGGGIAVGSSNYISLINSILWNNSSRYASELGLGNDGPDTVTVSYCDIRYGQDSVYIGDNSSDLIWGEGNIDEDPLFADPDNGDCHLTEDSPCIDAGDPDSDPDPDGTVADIGTFFFPQQNIAVEPDTLEFVPIEPGLIDSAAVTILNIGLDTLQVDSQFITPEENTFTIGLGGGEFSLEPDSVHLIWIVFSPERQADYEAVLTIESDDPDEEVVEILLRAVSTGIEDDKSLQPLDFGIAGVYPNPFNSQTLVRFSVPFPADITLKIYDISGRERVSLFNGHLQVGVHSQLFDGTEMPTGTYLVEMRSGGYRSVNKVVLIK